MVFRFIYIKKFLIKEKPELFENQTKQLPCMALATDWHLIKMIWKSVDSEQILPEIVFHPKSHLKEIRIAGNLKTQNSKKTQFLVFY